MRPQRRHIIKFDKLESKIIIVQINISKRFIVDNWHYCRTLAQIIAYRRRYHENVDLIDGSVQPMVHRETIVIFAEEAASIFNVY